MKIWPIRGPEPSEGYLGAPRLMHHYVTLYRVINCPKTVSFVTVKGLTSFGGNLMNMRRVRPDFYTLRKCLYIHTKKNLPLVRRQYPCGDVRLSTSRTRSLLASTGNAWPHRYVARTIRCFSLTRSLWAVVPSCRRRLRKEDMLLVKVGFLN